MRIFDPACREEIEAARRIIIAVAERSGRVQRLLDEATAVTAVATERVRKTHPAWGAAVAVAEALDAKVNAEVNAAMRATLYAINAVEQRILEAIVPPLNAAVAALDAMREEIAKAKRDLEGEMANLE